MKKYITNSEEETKNLGAEFSKNLQKNDIVALIGNLGGGKTVFTKGVALGLGIKDLITSPTFTLINEYNGKYPLYHFDLYRLSDIDELYSIGYDEYFSSNGVCLIEWADKFIDEFPDSIYVVKFLYAGENKREIMIFDRGEYKNV